MNASKKLMARPGWKEGDPIAPKTFVEPGGPDHEARLRAAGWTLLNPAQVRKVSSEPA